MIFKTQRLSVRPLTQSDADLFFELMGNPNVMNPIPQKTFTKAESEAKLAELILKAESSSTKIWGITKIENNNFIGICGFLKNDKNDDEIAYRLIERYWGKGLGTEVAKGLIDYGFRNLNLNKITADVNIVNIKSSKILEKFMQPILKFYNKTDRCTDRRYELKKEDWS